MTQHRHTPTEHPVRGHGRYDYKCQRCGRWIVWIAELPNRAGHWRVV